MPLIFRPLLCHCHDLVWWNSHRPIENERANGQSLPDFTILSIFKQAVRVSDDKVIIIGFLNELFFVLERQIEGLNSMHVLHNGIKPDNIFFSWRKSFLTDFDLSTLNDAQNEGHTPMFASKNFYPQKPRTAMGDLESLVYSMWYISDVWWSETGNPKTLKAIFSANVIKSKLTITRMQINY